MLISSEVVAAIKQDKEVLAGNQERIAALVNAKIVPHFNFTRMTQVAMAVNWRRTTPEQWARLTSEFSALLVHTYSGALMSYRDTFAEEVRNHGVDGLIHPLSSKNRQNDAKRMSGKAQDAG